MKQKFLAAKSSDTIRSRSRTGKHARQLKSAWTDEWDRSDTPDPLGMPLQPILVDQAIRRIDHAAHKAGSGAEQLANYFVVVLIFVLFIIAYVSLLDLGIGAAVFRIFA